jgi:hypothetical protein
MFGQTQDMSSLIAEKVEEAVQIKISDEDGGDAANTSINAYRQDCHNHLRNVWIGAVTKHLIYSGTTI